MSAWFANAMKYVDNFTDSLVEQQNALANEQRRIREENIKQKESLNAQVKLPWETDDDARAILSDDLKDKILELSTDERNFSVPPRNIGSFNFSLEAIVPLAVRLISIDPCLGKVHAKLIPVMGEESFWKNYFYRVEYLRASMGFSSEVLSDFKTGDCTIFKPEKISIASAESYDSPQSNENYKSPTKKPVFSNEKNESNTSPNTKSASTCKPKVAADIETELQHLTVTESKPSKSSSEQVPSNDLDLDDLDGIDMAELDEELGDMTDFDFLDDEDLNAQIERELQSDS
jgi:hypothetical protein